MRKPWDRKFTVTMKVCKKKHGPPTSATLPNRGNKSLCVEHDGLEPKNLRLFQHTELEHTPSNLYHQTTSRDSFHSGLLAGGLPLPGVRYRGVARNFLGKRWACFIQLILDISTSWAPFWLDLDPTKISFAKQDGWFLVRFHQKLNAVRPLSC